MRDFTARVGSAQVPNGSAALWWLSQAGFVLKNSGGVVIYLDPYLSDAAETRFGIKRLSLSAVDAEDVKADWLISSHEHIDHLDTGALPSIAANNPGCRFAGSTSCAEGYSECGIPEGRRLLMEPGREYDLDGVRVLACRADHGDLSPTALAMLFDFGQVRIMYTGDTAFRVDLLQPAIDREPDVLITCINGAFGNLNSAEAAELTSIVSPRVVIPCHFWMFREHNGNPDEFYRLCTTNSPEVEVVLLTPGAGTLVSSDAIKRLA